MINVQVPAPLPSIAPLPGGGTIPLNYFPVQNGFDAGNLFLLCLAVIGVVGLLYLSRRSDKHIPQSHGHR